MIDIWQYGFTEILNNAIEHSAGHAVIVDVTQTALNTTIKITDNGEGIFKKLQRESVSRMNGMRCSNWQRVR